MFTKYVKFLGTTADLLTPPKTLKKCPFCHKPVYLLRRICENSEGVFNGHHSYFVACTNQECEVQPHTKMYGDFCIPIEEAINDCIKSWNRH